MSATITFAPHLNGQVLQADASNLATMTISGTTSGKIDQIHIQLVPRAGWSGTGSIFFRLPIVQGTFSSSFIVCGGFYDLTAIGYQGYYPVTKTTISTGVGNVFLTGGQSQATNSLGPTPTSPVSDGVFCWNADNTWVIANDPQPVPDATTLASLWPTVGDLIVAATKLPVAFVCTGYGGSDVIQWTVANDTFWPSYLVPAFTRCGGNMLAFLWHQGEADAGEGTSQADYFSRLTSVIDASRTIVPNLPWGIAISTWNSGIPAGGPAIQAAQAQAQAYTGCFAGPDTDVLDDTYRRDGAHFNNSPGIPTAGGLWATAMTSGLGLTIPAPGPAPTPIPFVEVHSVDFADSLSGKSMDVSCTALTPIKSSHNFSISFWYKLDVSSLSALVPPFYVGTDTTQRIYFVNDAGTGNMDIYYNGVRIANTATPDTNWHHVVLTNSSAGPIFSFYFDGILAGTAAFTFDFTTGVLGVYGGSTPWGTHGGGKADEIAIYNTTLSSLQVSEIYNSGTPNNLSSLSSATNLATWWTMGDSSADTSSRIKDVIGLNNAPLTGSPSFSTDVP